MPRRCARVVELLDRVRRASGEERRAEVALDNDFPTASGLASSASGFAALALAAARAAGLDWDAAQISDLARRSSASAARSVFGGFVELRGTGRRRRRPGPEDALLAAQSLAPAGHLALAILVCVTTEARKTIGSTEGMRRTMAASPYARAWLDEAPRLHARLRDALLARDFVARRRAGGGERARDARERHRRRRRSTGPARPSTRSRRCAALRAEGTQAFATIDAGPHVKVLARASEAARVRDAMRATPGVRAGDRGATRRGREARGRGRPREGHRSRASSS